MKLTCKAAFLILGIIGLGIVQSCSEDENSDPVPSPTFPNTVTFSEITNTEFKMWTAGAEVNTAGLSVEDYIDSADYAQFSPAFYEAQPGLTFTEDSIFIEEDGSITGYPYYISNDSIYLTSVFVYDEDTVSYTSLLGIGNTSGFAVHFGYYKLSMHSGSGDSFVSESNVIRYTFNSVAEESGIFNSIEDISASDTLIIYNQDIIYN